MARLLIVHHSPSPTLEALTEAVATGARDEQIQGVETILRPALEATAEDVLAADGIILGTSANFGYMSGALKHFFDSTFLHIGGSLDTGGNLEVADCRALIDLCIFAPSIPFALSLQRRHTRIVDAGK